MSSAPRLAGFEVLPGPFELIGGLLALLLMAAFWVGMIYVVVKLIKRPPGAVASGNAGLRVLEERYARGEIARDEFLERRAVLTGERTIA